METNYSKRGVSSGKEDVHFAIRKLDKGLYPKAFCKVMPDVVANDADFCNLMHADGAGTKSTLAYLYWKETGDISVWRDLVQDAIVMNLDDMMCVGAVGNFLVSNTIGRNKFRIPREVLAEILEGMEALFENLRKHGVEIHNTGGETADIGDLVQTIVLDSTVFCRLKRSEVITNEKINENSVIVGLASFGQAIYEDTYNSGIGSNGLTNARHEVLNHFYRDTYPETFDQQNVPLELAYSGKFKMMDSFEDAPLNVGKLLLSPTRTYLPVVQEMLNQHFENIHGMIHCTGGGQGKCLKFVENLHIIKDNLFEIPPVFRLIRASANLSLQEMYQVFNMGHRLEIFTDETTAASLIKISEDFGIAAKIIGRCEKATQNQITLKTIEGDVVYR
ncbi:MAG: AIR synthase related protein [Bacteroidia bacterium]